MGTRSIRSWSYTTMAISCMRLASRAGIPPEFRRVLLPHFEELRIPRCPLPKLPERTEGRWGEGLTAAKMALYCWLDPFIVVRIEFLE